MKLSDISSGVLADEVAYLRRLASGEHDIHPGLVYSEDDNPLCHWMATDPCNECPIDRDCKGIVDTSAGWEARVARLISRLERELAARPQATCAQDLRIAAEVV